MNYTLNQLQVFLKVVQLRSVTRASEELHLTQPAVSIQLKNFQDQFDLPLTEIVGRKLHVTDFGLEIAAAAEQILDQVKAIQEKALLYKGQLAGRLSVSVVSTGKYVMPFFLAGFLQAHPGVELLMDVTNKSRVVQSLENNEMDFALVSLLPSKLPVHKLDLLRNKLYLVGKSQPEEKRRVYTGEIFQSIPLIFREQGSGTRQTMEMFIRNNHISTGRKMELTSNEAVKQAILAGLGYSIMPLIGIKNELIHGDLQIIPVKGLPIETTWSLIWLKGKKHSPTAKAFLDYLKEAGPDIVNTEFGWYREY
ncbi:MAG: LysR family transcriptional regulator [Bacteroidetes bacterium]|nr:LysR family transcriptional regulator [Bacteroidota bacterium]